MSDPTAQYLVSTNDTATFGKNARLWGIVVGTATATSVVTVYDGADTNGKVLAVIDAGTYPGTYDFWGLRCPGGCFVKMTTAAAKVSVIAE